MHILQTSVYLIVVSFTLRKIKSNKILSLQNGFVPFNVITKKKYSLKSSQKFSKMKCSAKAHTQKTTTTTLKLNGFPLCQVQPSVVFR